MPAKKPIQGLFYGLDIEIQQIHLEYPISGLCLGLHRESGTHPALEYYHLKLDDGSHHFIAKDTVLHINYKPPKPTLKKVK